MQKINKTIKFAIAYKNWYDENGKNIDYYSNRKFYDDVLAELLICQDGLCAYTERELLTKEEVKDLENKFIQNTNRVCKERENVNIEHFDYNLRKTDGWNWDNLFAVDAMINKYKATKPTNQIMKPDLQNYIPDLLLDYDCENHKFFAHTNLDAETAEQVEIMIITLGLNHRVIKNERKSYINCQLFNLKEIREHQYPTALKICKSRLRIEQ